MDWLATIARKQFSQSAEIDILARCLVATYFRFELQSKPKKLKGKYYGSDHILCRWPRKSPALGALLAQLSKSMARFVIDDRWIPEMVGDRSFFDEDGMFRKRVNFEAKVTISIILKEGSA